MLGALFFVCLVIHWHITPSVCTSRSGTRIEAMGLSQMEAEQYFSHREISGLIHMSSSYLSCLGLYSVTSAHLGTAHPCEKQAESF